MGELQETMSSEEFTQWMAFYRLEPFGASIEDARSARIQAIIAETNRDRKARSEPFTASDFMPEYFEEEPDLLPDEERIAAFAKFAEALGATVVREDVSH